MDDNTCTRDVVVNDPGTCVGVTCDITPTTTAQACNNNGTDSSSSDDIFDAVVNATGVNGGVSNQFNVTDGTTIWGPFDYGTGGTITGLPANGFSITLTFSDVDDTTCSAITSIRQASCSACATQGCGTVTVTINN